MPDEIEFEAHDPRETIEEVRQEHAGHAHAHPHTLDQSHQRWLRLISLSTAILAVLAAVSALQSATLVNEALLEQSKAVQSQAEASDAWAYFQAKGIKSALSAQTADIISATAAEAGLTESYGRQAQRYKDEQKELETKARELEKQRDEQNDTSRRFMRRHHPFAYCVTFTQIAIALSAIAALTRRRPVWYASLATGAIGAIFFLQGLLT